MKILTLIIDTLREIYAKKVILGIVLIEVVTLGLTAWALFSGGIQRDYKRVESGGVARSAKPSGRFGARRDLAWYGRFGRASTDR
jgi:hypothetical protein